MAKPKFDFTNALDGMSPTELHALALAAMTKASWLEDIEDREQD